MPRGSIAARARSMRLANSVLAIVGAAVAVMRWSPLVSRLEARVERVAEPVADQVDPEHGERDRGAGEDGAPPVVGQVVSSLAQHRAPLRRRRLRAEAEEAEAGGGQNRACDTQRREDDDGSEDARKDLPERDPDARCAQDPRGGDVLFLALDEDVASHDARERRDERDPDG